MVLWVKIKSADCKVSVAEALLAVAFVSNVAVSLVDERDMRFQTKENMRSVILLVFGLGMLCGGVPSQMTHAQSDGGIVRLSSAAYGPNSPVQENRLFRYQTSRYGFAYNCDGCRSGWGVWREFAMKWHKSAAGS